VEVIKGRIEVLFHIRIVRHPTASQYLQQTIGHLEIKGDLGTDPRHDVFGHDGRHTPRPSGQNT
jgi:hypothetical protein